MSDVATTPVAPLAGACQPRSVGALFEPRSVAVIGASDDADRIGGRPLRYLRESGFRGSVYPVNPNRDTVQGLRAFPEIAAIPHPVDLAIIALPAEFVLAAVEDCARHGASAVIVFSAGFAEVDAAGAALQQQLLEVARRTGMRILGPNCLGAFNTHNGFIGTFTQAFRQGIVAPGPVAIASQSGACGGHLAYLCKQRGIGVGYWVTTGNEADVSLSECILWLARAPGVRVIAAYAEAVRDGDRFVEALRTARANGKAVVMLKVGRSAAGARAAASHTGSLAGEDAVYDAVLRQYGVHRAESIEELLDIAYACACGKLPANSRVGIFTVSGGVGVQMADAAEKYGLEVPVLAQAAQDRIRALIPFAGTANPVDVTAQSGNDRSLFGRCLDITLSAGDFGTVVLFLTSAPADPEYAQRMLRELSELRQRYPAPSIVLSFVAPGEIVRQFEQAGFLVFEDVNRALRAVGAMATFARGFAGTEDQALQHDGAARPALAPGDLRALDEYACKQLLAAEGIPVLRELLATNAAEVRQAASRLGGPVVLKVVSPDIAHKTEVGGVMLDIATPEAAESAARTMLSRVRELLPEARLTGILVAPMCRGGIETICGVSRDPVFGPLVMFGLGGVHVEVMRDVTFRRAPVSKAEALSMIAEIRGAAILRGVRGAPPADVDSLAEVLVRLSDFAARNRGVIEGIDINPLVVMPQGQGAYALDALLVPAHDGGDEG